ncbi:choice-of-anchor Q domain-containing protein [Marinilabiliaceae bacterium ANBcel2]|nr:choice-of-anchor Q domain-containing protein [Marinilabiliaceae bacterium ANBcel2]
MKQLYRSIAFMVLGFFSFLTIDADVIYVRNGSESSAWQGRDNVYNNLYTALESAFFGDQLWVAEGVYRPSDSYSKDASFVLKEGVEIYGGFSGDEDSLEERNWYRYITVLSGLIEGRRVNNVVRGIGEDGNVISSSSRLDGLIIENGEATELSESLSPQGGGLYLQYASPVIANVWFRNNSSGGGGGAVYTSNSSHPLFVNTLFTDNQAGGSGGAVYSSSPSEFINCLWYGNSAENHNGALYGNISNSIINSIVWNNGDTPLSDIDITYSIVDGGHQGEGNIDKNPEFNNVISDDFRLRNSSPAINSGINGVVPDWLNYDYRGMQRIVEGDVDLGPFEGGLYTPEIISPAGNSFVDLETGTLLFKWIGEPAGTEQTSHYNIEYRVNGELQEEITDINDFQKEVGGFNGMDNVEWRVVCVDYHNNRISSQWSSFTIKRGTPLFVSPSGTGDGTSWSSTTSLEEALDNYIYGDELWLKSGIYLPSWSNSSKSFQLIEGVRIYGGFSGVEGSKSERNHLLNRTVISGEINSGGNLHTVFDVKSLETVSSDEITVIDGLKITGGDSSEEFSAGALTINIESKLIISNVKFSGNSSDSNGGALFVNEDGDVDIVNTLFVDNLSTYKGGAIYSKGSVNIVNSLWYGNSAVEGSAFYGNGGSFVVNSIGSNNSSSGGVDFIGCDVTYTYFDDAITGSGNIEGAPEFYSPEDNDFRLLSDSPAMGAGNVTAVPPYLDYDYRGEPRIVDSSVDMGPFQGAVIDPVVVNPEDGSWFQSDLAQITVEWDYDAQTGVIEYIAQYSINDETPIIVSGLSNTLFELENLTTGSLIEFFVTVKDQFGYYTTSKPVQFAIQRDHPVYVAPDGAGNGVSWSDASSLSTALDNYIFGDHLWLKKGSYTPDDSGDKTKSFELAPGIHLYGGFNGDEESLSDRDHVTNRTVLSGDLGSYGNSYNVVKMIGTPQKRFDSETVIDGLIISDGYNNSAGGGAVRLSYASPLFINCVIKNNHGYDGGALLGTDQSAPHFYNTLFKNNSASRYGGAARFSSGGAFFVNCIFYNNSASNRGGAVDNPSTDERVQIFNSVLWNNSAGYSSSQVYGGDLRYSVVEGGASGVQISSLNPQFVNPDEGDFRVNLLSSCVDGGSNDLLPSFLDTDFAGNNRIEGPYVDIGIFEGGVDVPIAIQPEQNYLFDPDNNSILFSWEWSEVEPNDIISYEIHYSIDGEEFVENSIDGLEVTIEGFSPATNIIWRICALYSDDSKVWSPVYSFSIKRDTPIFVSPNGEGSGDSWSSTIDLTTALDMAVYGDEIWVLEGVYKPDDGEDRSQFFEIPNGVKLYGGFRGDEQDVTERNHIDNMSVLSGYLENTRRSYQIVKMTGTSSIPVDNNTLIDGFTIEGGYANLNSGNRNQGGALYLVCASPTIKNIHFRDNYASNGGAVSADSNSEPLFANTIFTNNSSASNGGAIWLHNRGVIYNSLFYENSSGHLGGAVYANSNSQSKIYNSIFWQNSAGSDYNDLRNIDVVKNSLSSSGIGENALIRDPLFINSEAGDFRLNKLSPALDNGFNEVPSWLEYDYLGESRINGAAISVGPYENGVTTAVISAPMLMEIIDSGITETSVLWEWNGSAPDDVIGYSIEYYIDDHRYFVEGIDDMEGLIEGLTPCSKVNVRVCSYHEGGEVRWSPSSRFIVSRGYPVKVKVDGYGDGSSWDNAMLLHDALDNAIYGEEIWVAKGEYTPDATDRAKSFEIPEGVKLFGGFNGDEDTLEERDWNQNLTVLSGEIGDHNKFDDNSRNILKFSAEYDFDPITDNTVIDGFVIEKGYACEGGGAAALFENASPLILNTLFVNNFSEGSGGAVWADQNSSPSFANVLFLDNSSNQNGGAIFSDEGEIVVYNSLWYNNSAGNMGGALFGSNSKIYNSISWSNSAQMFNSFYANEVLYSVVEGGFDGEGNIDADPEFNDPANYDFTFSASSVISESGLVSLVPLWLSSDFYGFSRISEDETVNIGPFEKDSGELNTIDHILKNSKQLSFEVWPNPVTVGSNLNIVFNHYTSKGGFVVNILDVNGRIYFEKEFLTVVDSSLFVGELSKGIYFLKLLFDDGTVKTTKLLVQ